MHPHLYNLGNYALPSYGALAALGILSATLVAWRLGRRVGIDTDFILDAIFWTVLAGFAGARLAYVIITGLETSNFSANMLISTGGGVYLAGLLTGLATLLFLCRRRGLAFTTVADVFAPALALGHAFGRVGCHLAGCCWGCRVSSGESWFTVRYPRFLSQAGQLEGSWPYVDHLDRGWISPADPVSQPVVAVQLLEASYDLLLFAALLLMWRYRRFSGQIALFYGVAYSIGRFGLEYLRGDAQRGLYGPFSFSQWISLAALAGLAALATRSGFSGEGAEKIG